MCYGSETINNILSDYHLDRIHKMNVDEIYFSGEQMGFNDETIFVDGKKVNYLNTKNAWHQNNIESVIKKLNDEDKFIIMDSDLMIYDYSIFDDIFNSLDEYDIVSNLDGGTQIIPTWTTENSYDPTKEDPYRNLIYKIPIMRPTNFRSGRTRFAATLFGSRVKFYRKYNNSNPDSKFESMEEFSRNVAEFYQQVKVKELLDFRNSLYYNGDTIGLTINNDDIRCTNELFKSSKYYHIRNFGGSIKEIRKIIENKNEINTDFDNNRIEGVRLLSWLHIIIEKMNGNKKYKECLYFTQEIANYHQLSKDFFDLVISKTKEFHRTELL